MKKLLLIICILASFFGSSVFAQTTVYDLKEDFSSDVSSWDFTLNNGGTQTISYNTTNKLLQIRWPNSSSEYIKTLSTAITPGTDNKVTVDLIIKAYTSGNVSNYGAIYFLDESGNAITGFHVRRGSIGGSNKWFVGRSTSYPGTTTYSYPTSADGLNADQPTVKITFVLDFSAKTLSFTALQGTFDYITRVFTASGSSISSTDQVFINSAAANIKSLRSWYYRGANASGTNGLDIMYAGISALRNVATASVTVNYKDAEGNTLKTSRVQSDLVIGSTYYATTDDKATFSDENYFYAYNVASTDNVVVAEGAEINLIFKKTPVTAGNYVWLGVVNSNWNNADANFTADNGVTNIGYQNNNPIWFPAVVASGNKTINLNADLTVGENDIILAGDGYSLSGIGSIGGNGKFILDLQSGETATMGIRNNMTGGVEVKGGTAAITNDLGSAAFTMADGSSLLINTGAAFGKSINATGSVTITPTSNVYYTSTITNGETLNYLLGSAGSVTTAGVFSSMPILNNSFGGNINANSTLEVQTMFGSTNNFTNNKLYLSDNVSLVYPVNPASDGSTTISIGELSGTATSRLMGPRLRTVTYNVGGLGTNATFNGTVENFEADAWTNIPVINFTKSGEGQLSLTGSSTKYVAGTVNVNGGTLNVTGVLGATTVPVTVAPGATLKGTGTIAGATTVNGTLEGSLHFGSTLALAGTTNLTVTGFNTGEFDVLTVTGAVTNGGILNINLLNEPTGTGTIKLIAAPDGAYSGTFTAVNINTLSAPSGIPAAQRAKTAIGYSYDPLTGVLSYTDLGTGISEQNNAAEIYPTLTRGEVYVNAENGRAAEVITTSGKLLRQVKLNAALTTVNLTGLTDGIYLLKIKYNDGTDTTQQIILKK